MVIRLPVAVGAALLSSLVLSACATGAATDGRAAGRAARVAVENCGTRVEVDGPPRRIVSLNQGSTEILLSLGLADRMAGTATWTDPVLPSLAGANAGVERLADNAPSFEAVLDRAPDLVTASFDATLGEGGVATREQFERLGVATYLAPSDCVGMEDDGGDGTRTRAFEIDLVLREVRELARLTGVEERGEQLVTDLQRRYEEAARVDASGTSAMFWFANDESPYVAGCCGAPGVVVRTLGLENVFADTHQEWPQVGWETVAERDPDVIVLGDLTRRSQSAETAAAKIEFLESNPVTREMTAVKQRRYVTVSGAAMNPSLRTVLELGDVADQLVDLGLARRERG